MPDDHAFERSEVPLNLTAPLVSAPSEEPMERGFASWEGWYLLIFLAGLAGWICLALIIWTSIN